MAERDLYAPSYRKILKDKIERKRFYRRSDRKIRGDKYAAESGKIDIYIKELKKFHSINILGKGAAGQLFRGYENIFDDAVSEMFAFLKLSCFHYIESLYVVCECSYDETISWHEMLDCNNVLLMQAILEAYDAINKEKTETTSIMDSWREYSYVFYYFLKFKPLQIENNYKFSLDEKENFREGHFLYLNEKFITELITTILIYELNRDLEWIAKHKELQECIYDFHITLLNFFITSESISPKAIETVIITFLSAFEFGKQR